MRCCKSTTRLHPLKSYKDLNSISRSRKEGESIAAYVAELRSLVERCNFGDTLSIMLWDRLVCAVNIDTVQKRWLAESKLTFEDALKIATSMEAATAGVQELMRES